MKRLSTLILFIPLLLQSCSFLVGEAEDVAIKEVDNVIEKELSKEKAKLTFHFLEKDYGLICVRAAL